MARKPASFYDSRGMLVVDCAECKRGGNGEGECGSGGNIKIRKRGSCFSGELLDGIEVK